MLGIYKEKTFLLLKYLKKSELVKKKERKRTLNTITKGLI